MSATLDDIMARLNQIHALITARPAAAARPANTSSDFNDEPVPQPSEVWNLDDAKERTVHFGKNSGTALGDMKETQLAWYAKDKPPMLKRDGTPFTPRQADTDLLNAARTLWHHNRGTMAGSNTPSVRSDPPAQKNPPPQENLDEDVPF